MQKLDLTSLVIKKVQLLCYRPTNSARRSLFPKTLFTYFAKHGFVIADEIEARYISLDVTTILLLLFFYRRSLFPKTLFTYFAKHGFVIADEIEARYISLDVTTILLLLFLSKLSKRGIHSTEVVRH
jgi:glycosylphosphatidylinositol transamidase (GPIT) subunit GPI8